MSFFVIVCSAITYY